MTLIENEWMRVHCVYGCTIATDLDLHLPEAGTSTRPEVTLRRSTAKLDNDWAPEPADLLAGSRDDDRGIGFVAGRTPCGYRLRFEGLCEFDISGDLTRVTWKRFEDGNLELVAILAVGAVMAFRLMMAGHLVLHASAVHVRGRGLAFVGASGMGKSTMATLMCAGGATMVTDDVARIDLDSDRARLAPGPQESRLRPAAATLVELFRTPGAMRTTSDGRTALGLPAWTHGSVTLNAVVVPLPSREQAELVLSPISPAQALIFLGHFPRLPGWVDTEVLAQQFNRLADLVERVPVYLAIVPWGPPFRAETASQLLAGLGWADGG